MLKRFLRPAETWLAVKAPRRGCAHAKDDRAEVFRIDGHFVIVLRRERLAGEGFDGAFGLLARFVEGLQIGAEGGDSLPGDVLRHVAPVRADIGHGSRGAALLGVDAPVPVGVVEQPVLRIGALHDEDFAQVAVFAHAAHVLDHRVVAQIVAGAVAEVLDGGQLDQRGCLRARNGERLLAEHVFAGFERGLRHGKVGRVGRADVDGIDGRIGDDVAQGGFAARGDGVGFDGSQAADSLQMDAAHEAGSDDRGSHGYTHHAAPGFSRGTI